MLDFGLLEALAGAERVSPLIRTSEKRVMAQTMQHFA